MSFFASLSELGYGLGQGALELFCPTRCVGCNLPGELLCEDCRTRLAWIEQRWACPSCGAPYGWLTCTECKGDWELDATVCALGFDGISSQMITVFKDQHELRLAPVIAAAMACSIEEAAGCRGTANGRRIPLGGVATCAGGAGDISDRVGGAATCISGGTGSAGFSAAVPGPAGSVRAVPNASAIDAICFVPATGKAYARRGYDHMELVARALSVELGIPVLDVLTRDTLLDQRELGREERAENLAGTVGVIEDVGGLSLLLIDDVVTTGSTIREAARALKARGASAVYAAALARVW